VHCRQHSLLTCVYDALTAHAQVQYCSTQHVACSISSHLTTLAHLQCQQRSAQERHDGGTAAGELVCEYAVHVDVAVFTHVCKLGRFPTIHKLRCCHAAHATTPYTLRSMTTCMLCPNNDVAYSCGSKMFTYTVDCCKRFSTSCVSCMC
jgi:hypothetical protein